MKKIRSMTTDDQIKDEERISKLKLPVWKKVLLALYVYEPKRTYFSRGITGRVDDKHPLALLLKIKGFELESAFSFLQDHGLIHDKKSDLKEFILTEEGLRAAMRIERHLDEERSNRDAHRNNILMIFLTAVLAYNALVDAFLPQRNEAIIISVVFLVILTIVLIYKNKEYINLRPLDKKGAIKMNKLMLQISSIFLILATFLYIVVINSKDLEISKEIETVTNMSTEIDRYTTNLDQSTHQKLKLWTSIGFYYLFNELNSSSREYYSERIKAQYAQLIAMLRDGKVNQTRVSQMTVEEIVNDPYYEGLMKDYINQVNDIILMKGETENRMSNKKEDREKLKLYAAILQIIGLILAFCGQYLTFKQR